MGLRIGAPASTTTRRVSARSSYCVVLYWHYKKQNFGTMSNFRKESFDSIALQVEKGVISEEIRSLKVSKSLAQPSGIFDIEIHPTQNWKAKLSPGDWIAIYFFDHTSKNKDELLKNPSTENLVMLGNVDRISRSISKDDKDDKTRLSYHLSGRNFGKVFEETDVWYDPYATQVKTTDSMLRKAGLEIVGSPNSQTKAVVDVFLGPGGNFPSGKTAPLLQWQIPVDVANMFGVTKFVVPGKPMFYDILNLKISKLPGFKVRNMLTLESNGSVWEMLTRSCNKLINELYLEEMRADDGTVKPTLTLRPRPLQTIFFEDTGDDSQFGEEDAKIRKGLSGAYKTMQKHARESFITINPAEVKFENLGRDEHARFNMFWLKTTLEYEYFLATVANINVGNGIGNPVFVRESIHRHGLKRFDQVIDFCYAQGADPNRESQSATKNIDLWKAFMVQLYDFHYANHLYEAGTMEVVGRLEAELGKCLVLESTAVGKSPKVYYIEGYEHNWKFPSTWTTTFTVTHGQFLVDQGNNIFIDSADGDFGQPDTVLDTTYLAKTQTRKT